MRLAVVGTKLGHSRAFQLTLTQLPDVEVVAILDDGGTIIPPFQHLPTYGDPGALLDQEHFDAAIVTVPANQAPDVLTSLASAGKHLLCDKPVCRNADEMQRVIEAVREHDVRFAVAYNNRFRPVHERAKALIQQGRLGTVFALQACLFTTSPEVRGVGGYSFDRERSGGGILNWLGCHMIDMLLDISGMPVTSVMGSIATISESAIDVEDVGCVALQFEGGAVASLVAGYTMPKNVEDPYRFSNKDTRLEVWGSRAKLELEPFGITLQLVDYEANPDEPVRLIQSLPYPMTPGYVGATGLYMVKDFLASIAERRRPRADETDALRVLEVLDTVYGTGVRTVARKPRP